ncbi:DUF6578 domain-containing protein [Nocardioides sp. CPCC 205120]|uniref:DUF6578 domain-containing protein n=1 Tax=Nocardioides sp. CPCC 205120 TaxID=3406462 RepID=UPI003B50F245
METVVWIDEAEAGCCGPTFATSDVITWHLAPEDGWAPDGLHELDPELGEVAWRLSLHEDPAPPEQRGRVRRIQALEREVDPDPQVPWPAPLRSRRRGGYAPAPELSSYLVDVPQVHRDDEPSLAGRRIVGWLVDLDLFPVAPRA